MRSEGGRDRGTEGFQTDGKRRPPPGPPPGRRSDELSPKGLGPIPQIVPFHPRPTIGTHAGIHLPSHAEDEGG